MVQTHTVQRALAAINPELEIEIRAISTSGDILKDAPLAEIGGKGVFVKDIEQALLDGRVDLAVHSLKDMQAVLPQGLRIAACLEREDARDMLFSVDNKPLAELPAGSRIGTSSLRRKCQIKACYPELELVDIRGNVSTRLNKVGEEVEAVILASAGIKRLKLDPGQAIEIDDMLPSPGQGIIAIQTRTEDHELNELLKALDHKPSRMAAETERAFLATLGADCNLPAGAYATYTDGRIELRGLLGSSDLTHFEKLTLSGTDPAIGREAAEELRAKIKEYC